MSELMHKQYPYPEENVLLVFGTLGGKGSNSIAKMIVSKTPQRAIEYYETISADTYKAHGATSLKEMREMLLLLERLKTNPVPTTQIQKGWVSKIFKQSPQIWVATVQKDDQVSVQMVQAAQPADVMRHFEKQNYQVLNITSDQMLAKTVLDMEQVQMGKGEHSYAIDHENGELVSIIKHQISITPQYELEKQRERMRRVREKMAQGML